MTDLHIYIATHKKFNPPKDPAYIPIQVGTSLDLGMGYMRENQGDNIAVKNPYYCELTALYYIWKNDPVEYQGLVHYRRYFVIQKQTSFHRKIEQFKHLLHLSSKSTNNKNRPLNGQEILSLLTPNSVIIPKATIFPITIRQQYQQHHHIQDLDTVRQVIAQQCPSYLLAFDQMQNGHKLYATNMIITHRNILNSYCQWLFAILETVEKYIDFTHYNAYNQRVFGFLSERLFTAWKIHHQNDYIFHEITIAIMEDN